MGQYPSYPTGPFNGNLGASFGVRGDRSSTITTQRPFAVSSADVHRSEFDYKINTSHVDPATGNVLPRVNPLSQIPRHIRSGKIQQVLYNQSRDPRGPVDYLVGATFPTSNADPRAEGAFRDNQSLAYVYKHDKHVPVPVQPTCVALRSAGLI